MSVEERDFVSRYLTTGHDWKGIKDLNARVPRIVFAIMVVTHLYALVAWFMRPTWLLGQTFAKGLLGLDQKTAVTADLDAANAVRAGWTDALATLEFDAIRTDPDLMARACQGGSAVGADLSGLPWRGRHRRAGVFAPERCHLAVGRHSGRDCDDPAVGHKRSTSHTHFALRFRC